MKEVVILVGMPGSGKTHYCRTGLPHHVRASQDEGPRHFAGVFAKYLKLLEAGTEQVVVDRTNPMAAQRAQFVAAARQRGYRVRIIHFDLPRALCEQRIRQRSGHPTLDAGRMAQAINRYLATLDAPQREECDELLVLEPPGECLSPREAKEYIPPTGLEG
ncbi:MAG: ATP-binding protein [Phycisphaerae bacterium]|nr:ATP-binding protein [Phycisphaerae bacterium]